MSMKDVRALLDGAVAHANAAGAFMITGNEQALPCYIAMQAEAVLAIALLLELRERRELGGNTPVKPGALPGHAAPLIPPGPTA